MKRISFLLASLLLAGCVDTEIQGAIVRAPLSIGSIDAPCKNREFAARLGDMAVLLWAKRLVSRWGVPYADAVKSVGNPDVCIIDPTTKDHLNMCGSVAAVGCAGGWGGWLWIDSADSKWDSVPLMVHEMGHLVAQGLGISDSAAHSEKIHTELEPLVEADARLLNLDE